MKFVMSLFSLIVVLGIASGCATTSGSAEADPAPSETTTSSLMAFQATDIAGEYFDLADHLGQKTILMNFWATWSGDLCLTTAKLLNLVATSTMLRKMSRSPLMSWNYLTSKATTMLNSSGLVVEDPAATLLGAARLKQ